MRKPIQKSCDIVENHLYPKFVTKKILKTKNVFVENLFFFAYACSFMYFFMNSNSDVLYRGCSITYDKKIYIF